MTLLFFIFFPFLPPQYLHTISSTPYHKCKLYAVTLPFCCCTVRVQDLVSFRTIFPLPDHLKVAGKLCLGAGAHLIVDGAVQIVGSFLPILGLEGQLGLLVDDDGL